LIRGGHLQTIASIHVKRPVCLPTRQHVVGLSDGDAIVLHEDQPPTWRRGDSSIVLIHGLCGCHATAYMLRLADAFFARGIRVFRLDMRGCGAGVELASQLTHAGRSDDILAALGQVARLTESGKIGAIGVSLGGNQLLRAVGRVGAGADRQPDWFDRLDRVAVVSPPVDLPRCSENMQRWVLRPYNYYFIRKLLARVPPQVRMRSDFQQVIALRRPTTLMELDERITAPLSGFRSAADYYQQCSAMHVTGENRVKTLVIAAADDPVVPIDCFTVGRAEWPDATELLISSKGGHVGFIDRQRQSWMDQVLAQWFEGF
jgi:predicted alpha/beta-fold hydrolase